MLRRQALSIGDVDTNLNEVGSRGNQLLLARFKLGHFEVDLTLVGCSRIAYSLARPNNAVTHHCSSERWAASKGLFMIRLFSFAALLSLLAVLQGCSSSTTPTTEEGTSTAEASKPADSTGTSVADLPSDSSLGGGTDGDESNESVDLGASTKEKTPEDYLAEIQAIIDAIQSGETQPTALNDALDLVAKSVEQFPDDENLLRTKTALFYQSLQAERDPTVANERRLELGRLARLLVERNKDQLDQLGNMPSILLAEEARAHLTNNNVDKAWHSMEDSYANGFAQPQFLFMDPAFESLVNHETYGQEIKKWLKDSLATQLADFESFPFDFSLQALNGDAAGEEVKLTDFIGQPVIVDFWGTWCPPCRAALPHLVDLHNKHKDELVILGINFEERSGATSFDETKEIFDSFAKSEPLPYTCLYGKSELTSQVPGFRGFPTMVFVDKKGDVRLSLTGYNPAPVLEAVIETLLAE